MFYINNLLTQMNIDIDALKRLMLSDASNPLLFNTGLFLLLFAAFIGFYSLVSHHRRTAMAAVIAFSLYFYYKASGIACLILIAVAVSDYFLGLWMGRTDNRAIKRFIVALNVAANIGMLAYFKYLNLLIQTITQFSTVQFDALNIILPAGISFFTFRSISYIVDLYRGKMKPCRSAMDYIFFLTFFPPLLAGPVVRASEMLPQIQSGNRATRAMVAEGIFLIMSGLIKKMVVADYIGPNFVDRVFDNPTLYTGVENVFAMIGYTMQIYCDFSGYSDMAIGLALLLGYRFGMNFDRPFVSRNPTEFWRRWHISLSSWLRDYLYIPLGGNRKGSARKHINLSTTMLLGGLWHGASWMYLLWGGYQGLLLSGHKMLAHRLPRLPQSWQWFSRTAAVLSTLTLTIIGFTIFRCRDLETFSGMATQVATAFHPEAAIPFAQAYALILTLIGAAYAIHFSPVSWRFKLMGKFASSPLIIQAIILAIVLFIVIQTRSSDIVPFVYLQY